MVEDTAEKAESNPLPRVPLRYLLVLVVAMLCMSPENSQPLCDIAPQISSLIV